MLLYNNGHIEEKKKENDSKAYFVLEYTHTFFKPNIPLLMLFLHRVISVPCWLSDICQAH